MSEASKVVLAALASTPGRVAALVQGLDESRLRTRPPSGEFSILENVVHLRDIDAEGFCLRVRRILEEDRPLLPGVDGARLAAERRYSEQPLAPALAELTAGRGAALERIASAGAGALTREGTLAGVGTISLARLLALWRDHDAEHLAAIERLLAFAS